MLKKCHSTMLNSHKQLLAILASSVLLIVIGHAVAHAFVFNTSSSVYITAQVGDGSGTGTGTGGTSTSTTAGGGGGGGGGSSAASTATTGIPTTVNFSGMGYPSSKVVILEDGTQVITTVSDPNANFSASLTGIVAGTYTFSVYTTDSAGLHSVSYSFPVFVTTGTTVNIGGIILAPTIDVDKSEVIQGENEAIFGYSVPNSTVTISVHSDVEHIVKATASASGAYLYNFDTTPLELGTHNAQSHAILADQVSTTTDPISFIVGDQDIAETKPAPTGCGGLVGDSNCDGKVNLVDFSIMAYWYKKGTTPPASVDLNSDGKINLVDFSILAYHWTG
jgi:hypothetical protein